MNKIETPQNSIHMNPGKHPYIAESLLFTARFQVALISAVHYGPE